MGETAGAPLSLPSLLTLMEMKFAPLSLATALASSVFPHPGGPYNNTPEDTNDDGGETVSVVNELKRAQGLYGIMPVYR